MFVFDIVSDNHSIKQLCVKRLDTRCHMGWTTYCVQIEGTDMSLGLKLNVIVSSAMCGCDIRGNVRA